MHTKTYHYLYKITNNLNGKIYIGVHATDNMDDGYMGSGRLIRHAIIKHGVENFTKEVLQTFESTEAMYAAESLVVNESFVLDDNTYNITVGGNFGGFYVVQPDGSLIHNNIGNHRHTGNYGFNLVRPDVTNPEFRKKISAGVKRYIAEHGHNWTGKHHSEETKVKIGKANSVSQRGSKNSQYGKIWISNNETQQSKRIPKTSEIPEGWVLGRNNWKTVSREQAEQYRRDAFNAKVISRRAKKQESDRDKAIKLHKLYTEHGFSSIREFARSEFYDKSHVTLSKLFKLL